MELNFSVEHRVKRGFCQFVHLHKPLLGDIRLNRNAAAFGVTDIIHIIFRFNKQPEFFQACNNFFAALIAVESAEFFRDVVVCGSIFVKDVYEFQFMAHRHIIVVEVVGGSYLNRACTEFFINIFIRKYRNQPAGKRKFNSFTD